MKRYTAREFGEAKSLAQRLANREEVEYVVFNASSGYLIVSVHDAVYEAWVAIRSLGPNKEIDAQLVYQATPGVDSAAIFRAALETIAYPANWPREKGSALGDMQNWMQSVAADALTNGGKKERS